MKTLLIAFVSIAIIVFIGLGSKNPSAEQLAEKQLAESRMIQDSAMVLLEELRKKNDSLLIKYFGK